MPGSQYDAAAGVGQGDAYCGGQAVAQPSAGAGEEAGAPPNREIGVEIVLVRRRFHHHHGVQRHRAQGKNEVIQDGQGSWRMGVSLRKPMSTGESVMAIARYQPA